MNSTDGGFDRYIRMETLHMYNTVSEAHDVQLTSAQPSERNFDFASITLFPPFPTCVVMDNSFACGYLSKVSVKMVVTTSGGGLDQYIRIETLYIKTTQFPAL